VDSDFWQQIEAYISEHSDAVFSHGICPECAVRLYPEVFGDAAEKSKQSRQKGASKNE
jgi:hypothetical protein